LHQTFAERRAHTAVPNAVVDHDADSHWVRVRPRRRAQGRIALMDRKQDDGRRAGDAFASAVVVQGRAVRKTPDWRVGARETKTLLSTMVPGAPRPSVIRRHPQRCNAHSACRQQPQPTFPNRRGHHQQSEKQEKQCTQCLPATDTNAALPLNSTPRTIQVC